MFLPQGDATGRPESTVVWWMLSPLQLQKSQPLSSGHGRQLTRRLLAPKIFDPAHQSGPLTRHPGGHVVLRHFLITENRSGKTKQKIRQDQRQFSRIVWRYVNIFWNTGNNTCLIHYKLKPNISNIIFKGLIYPQCHTVMLCVPYFPKTKSWRCLLERPIFKFWAMSDSCPLMLRDVFLW